MDASLEKAAPQAHFGAVAPIRSHKPRRSRAVLELAETDARKSREGRQLQRGAAYVAEQGRCDVALFALVQLGRSFAKTASLRRQDRTADSQAATQQRTAGDREDRTVLGVGLCGIGGGELRPRMVRLALEFDDTSKQRARIFRGQVRLDAPAVGAGRAAVVAIPFQSQQRPPLVAVRSMHCLEQSLNQLRADSIEFFPDLEIRFEALAERAGKSIHALAGQTAEADDNRRGGSVSVHCSSKPPSTA